MCKRTEWCFCYGLVVVLLFGFVPEWCLRCVMCVAYDVMSCVFVAVLLCVFRLLLCVSVRAFV